MLEVSYNPRFVETTHSLLNVEFSSVCNTAVKRVRIWSLFFTGNRNVS